MGSPDGSGDGHDDRGIVVDSRPLAVVLMSRSYRWLAFIGLGVLFWILLAWPTPSGLTEAGQRTLAAFVICLILWVTRLLPLAVTSLFAITLIQLLGVMESGKAFSLFGNQAVFFILGAFILAAALMKTGLSARIALLFLRKFGGSPKRLLLGALIVPAFLSFWMPEHAVAAMLFPIIIEITHSLGVKPKSGNFGHAIFLSLAWGAAIGGVATFLGGARNALAVGILKQTTGQFIGFFEWMIAVVPLVIIMLILAYFIINRFFPTELESVSQAVDVLEERNRKLGKATYEERMVGLIMALTVLAWIFMGGALELASIAIVAVVALFVFKLVKWRDLEEYVNWGIILMYGGAIALGFALEDTGAAGWLADVLITRWTTSPMVIIIVLALISIILTEGMSNAAVVAMMVPVGLGIAQTHGIDPKIIIFAIAVPAGLGFAMPMGNPPNAIAYSSGFIDPKRMFKVGLLLDVCAWGVFILMVKFYWPLINIRL